MLGKTWNELIVRGYNNNNHRDKDDQDDDAENARPKKRKRPADNNDDEDINDDDGGYEGTFDDLKGPSHELRGGAPPTQRPIFKNDQKAHVEILTEEAEGCAKALAVRAAAIMGGAEP
jgi:hypothetical protein